MNTERLPHQQALDAWNAFRMKVEGDQSKPNIERLMDYQELIVAADRNFSASTAAKEKKKLLQEHSVLILADEKLRNRYYHLLGEFRKEEATSKQVQKPKHWEQKFIPNAMDEYEHNKAKEDKKKIQVGFGGKNKDNPDEL